MQKGIVASFFLSIKRTFECIVNALFCCLDIEMTNNSGFTLSRKWKKVIFLRFFEKKEKFSQKCLADWKKLYFCSRKRGALAQLARALAWHARGHRFDSVMLHKRNPAISAGFFVCQQHKRFPSGMELIRLINQRRLVTHIIRIRYLPPL